MSPDTVTARRWVLVSMLGLLALATYRGNLSGDQGLLKRLWGVGMLGLMLSLAADIAPALAGPFAILVLVGYTAHGGDQAIQNILGKVSGGGTAAAPASPQATVTVHPPGPAQPGTTR